MTEEQDRYWQMNMTIRFDSILTHSFIAMKLLNLYKINLTVPNESGTQANIHRPP